MAKVLETKDRTGRTIYLTDERYAHIKNHPEMQDSLRLIEKAVENPQKITTFPLDPDIRHFHTYHKNRKSKAKYLRVIVKYVNGEGFIITAFFVVEIV